MSGASTTTAQHSASSAPAYGATTPSSPAASGAAVTLTAGTSKFGAIITEGGRVVYLFKKDTRTTSACSGACQAAWPPVLISGTPAAGTGIRAALLGTAKRSDGITQVTYGGHLLAAAYGITLLISGRAARKQQIPFGPFVIAGAFLVILAGA